jgi:hypothetical protein
MDESKPHLLLVLGGLIRESWRFFYLEISRHLRFQVEDVPSHRDSANEERQAAKARCLYF